MPKKSIVHEPSKVLHGRAGEVPLDKIKGERIQRLILDMKETLAAAPDGVGLAAPQVGVPLRIFLVSEEAFAIDAGGEHAEEKNKKWDSLVFINPVLTKRSRKKIDMVEGCLSLPRTAGVVPRAEKVSLAWYDEHGKKRGRGFTRFFARVIQHEMDHLEGALLIDRAKKNS
jgi:peptide deformylase